MSPIVIVHVFGAVIGLLSGFLALFVRKGSGTHGAAGTVFFASMIGMTTSAAYAATFIKPVRGNVLVALLTLYLVTTAWRAAKNRSGKLSAFDLGALLFVLADAMAGVTWGFQSASRPGGFNDGLPTAPYFIFGAVALLCGVSDIRMLRRGSLTGARRIARHLWRMGLALLIAALSLYPGRPQVFPKWLRQTNLLWFPSIVLFGMMLFYLVRVRRRGRLQEARRTVVEASEPLVRKVA